MKTNTATSGVETCEQGRAVSVGSGPLFGDWNAQLDALIADTRKGCALPSDACVIVSLAAQTLLARRELDRLREDNRALRKIAANDSWSKELQDAIDAIPARFIGSDYWVNGIARMAAELDSPNKPR